ncbi:GNAT family N-acetyltransferase [Catelliglobosispora koreensis]|uniref:GNAT family N-acetyltransferase n=1 Tax=Catelliglobosispora koreensis TaxID=129052 RepID=UPI00036485FD|nr:GNAT family N-acetyltransferase [Catelliglobosispora koreensis]
MHIRDTTIDDVRAFCEIRKELFPWLVASLAAQENWYRTQKPKAQAKRIAAEIDGEIVAFALGGLNVATSEEGAAWAGVAVRPSFQGQGIGSALWTQLEAHLRAIGARRTQTWAAEGSTAFAERRGFSQGASLRYSFVEPGSLPPVPAIAEGVTFVTAAEVGPDVLYELDTTASADEPSDIPYDRLPKQDWLDRVWNSPDLSHDLSIVALVDGVPAAATFLEVNGERAWAAGTVTLREFRGRGLSKIAKSLSLREAAKQGVTHAFTSNDYTNAPMLAINDWLGYKVVGTQWSYLKDVSC